ncbi:MAG: hypothetical protein ACM3OC_09540 [Deltaproteobacteria bacterium]
MVKKILSLFICTCFSFTQTGLAQIADISGAVRTPVLQQQFSPLHLRYLSYDANSEAFNLFVDKGSFRSKPDDFIKDNSGKLFEYFLVGIALPDSSFWVNLRPDSPDRIIDPLLEKTEVGRILLEADLQLKKDVASLTSPDTQTGREYWRKLYEKAETLMGSNAAIPTVTRPWIVPDEVIIQRGPAGAYIYKATLKVMLEQDRLKDSPDYSFNDERLKELNAYSTTLVKELIIPQLTKEINSSKRYSELRQVFYSLILAQWFKKQFKGTAGGYARMIESSDISSLVCRTPVSKETYFSAYRDSFAKGEYNTTEQVNGIKGMTVRRYCSGGIVPVIQTDGPERTDITGYDGGRLPFIGPDLLAISRRGQDSAIITGMEQNPAINLDGGNGRRPYKEQVDEVLEFAGRYRKGVDQTDPPYRIESWDFGARFTLEGYFSGSENIMKAMSVAEKLLLQNINDPEKKEQNGRLIAMLERMKDFSAWKGKKVKRQLNGVQETLSDNMYEVAGPIRERAREILDNMKNMGKKERKKKEEKPYKDRVDEVLEFAGRYSTGVRQTDPPWRIEPWSFGERYTQEGYFTGSENIMQAMSTAEELLLENINDPGKKEQNQRLLKMLKSKSEFSAYKGTVVKRKLNGTSETLSGGLYEVGGPIRERAREILKDVKRAEKSKKDGGVTVPEKDGGKDTGKGGVDFMSIPITMQATFTPRNIPIPSWAVNASLATLAERDRQIEKQIRLGCCNYGELREYAAACCARKDTDELVRKLAYMVAGILKDEERKAAKTPDELKEILALLF